MKCLYCKNEGVGMFCSSCGEKFIDTNTFSLGSFLKILGYVHQSKNDYLSNDFKKEIELGDYVPWKSADTILKSYKLFGYLIRITEEFFYHETYKKTDVILNILDGKKSNLSIATDYIDTKMSSFDLGFGAIDQSLFLLSKEGVVDIFNNDISINISKTIENLEKDPSVKNLESERFAELCFRNATWGYCYRIAEEHLLF